MRAKLNLLSAFVLGIAGGAVVGCQTYDFEPVEPLAIEQPTIEQVVQARSLKPNMMMLVDTSGSMVDATQCGQTTCPTRWKALQDAMQGFLSQNGAVARLGLSTYPGREKPSGVACGATQDSEIHVPLPADNVDDDAALVAQASQVNAVIQGISESRSGSIANMETGGGTPTNASLRFVGGLTSLASPDREDFILLLTDGLPNCNPDNPNTGPSDACKCTQRDPSVCSPENFLEKLGCLDKDGSVAAIQELRTKNIKTIVIGFGAETSAGDGPATLNAMAEAGGFPRQCAPGTTDCNKFFQAATQAELAQALKEIIDLVAEPCILDLLPEQRPPNDSEALMVVYINDESLQPGPETWNLVARGVQFNGATCTRIKSSSPTNPANITIRVVRPR